jgi:hypothetical protein
VFKRRGLAFPVEHLVEADLSESWRSSPKAFPVNFLTRRRTLLFRIAQSFRLFRALMNGRIATAQGGSVIDTGRAHVLSATAEIPDAKEARLLPWTATLKPLYIGDWVVRQR